MSLKDKIVIVTGAGSGIGRETAKLLAAEGAKVVIADICETAGESTAEEILRTGGPTCYVKTDASDENSVAGMVERVLFSFGPPFGLVNNAGISNPLELTQTPPGEWDRILAVNLRSVYLCTRAVLPSMRRRGEGSVVNIASVHANFAFPGYAAYDASKAGMVALTRTIALENGPYQIRANVICPGYIDTPMWDDWLAKTPDPRQMDRDTKQWHPLRRRGTPLDVAKAVKFLLSEDSAWITGTNLVVDGGLSVRYFGY